MNSQNYIKMISIVQQLKGGEIKLEYLHIVIEYNNKEQEQEPQTLMSIGRKESCEMIERQFSIFSFHLLELFRMRLVGLNYISLMGPKSVFHSLLRYLKCVPSLESLSLERILFIAPRRHPLIVL